MAFQAQPAGGQPGIHWFGPGGSGIGYPQLGAESGGIQSNPQFVPHPGFIPSQLQSVGGGLRDHPIVSALQTLLDHFSGGGVGIPEQPQGGAIGSGVGFPTNGDPSGPMIPDPHQVLQDVVNFHRQSNGLSPMQPEDLHGRVANLAQQILQGRQSRLQQSLRGIRNPGGVGHPGPQYQNFSAR
jgi:hypothetical protein